MKQLSFMAATLLAQLTMAQPAASGADPVAQDPAQTKESAPETTKRIAGFVPNYRTTTLPDPYVPLTTKQKFATATQDSFDPGNLLLVGIIAGTGQATDSNPSFGQGAKGFAHRYVTTYSDNVIGNYMTEAIYPTLFHHDPRYFMRAKGSGWSRLGYAMGQIFMSHDDEGHPVVN